MAKMWIGHHFFVEMRGRMMIEMNELHNRNKIPLKENPFTRLENAEQESASRFVNIFSDYIVNSCMELYRPGNVIVTGIEGSGKSMLLSLLKPEIRIEYFKRDRRFPINEKFLGAGINFTRSGLMDIGSRIVSRLEFGNYQCDDAPKFFGDFINYWVARDIINTVKTYKEALDQQALLELVGLNCTPENLQHFTLRLASSTCWSGYMSEVDSFESLVDCLTDRINTYRMIATQGSPKPFKPCYYNTLTDVGEPISQTVSALYESEVLDVNTPVFVRFDQYEDLIDAVDFDVDIAKQYQRIVNKFLWTRDPNVSFKIGTRPYAIFDNLRVYGLGSQQLEPERHFCKIDLDDKLRRKEDSSSWLFAKFADDVFSRRLSDAGYPSKTILDFFGRTMSPHRKAQMIVGKDSRERALGSLEKLDKLSATFLIDLAVGKDEVKQYSRCIGEGDSGDLLSAKLGVAWILQGKEFDPSYYHKTSCPHEAPFALPWNEKKAQWWKKERINQALLQISSSSGQRTNWSGKEDIITLSSNNILIFLNICREIWRIWDQAIKAKNQKNIDFGKKPIIEARYQSAGIYTVSSIWYNKVIARPQGDLRKKLINKISKKLSTKLKNDVTMSYPGHNGFSIAVSEYEMSEIKTILQSAVRYGDLIELPHTPKNRNQERRRKWYLLPILSPELGLPASHTKEPYYIRIKTLENWVFDLYNNSK